jgi:hypothetical protein
MNTKTQAQTDSDASFFRELCKPANDAFDELERDYPKLFAEPPQELPRERDKAFQEELNAYENQRFDNVTSLTLAPKPWEPQEETVACEPPQEQTVAKECPAVHGEDCTDDHCQCDCHFSYDDPHEDSREVNGR